MYLILFLVIMQTMCAAQTLSFETKSKLEQAGWPSRVGDKPAIWVSVREQKLRLIQQYTIKATYDCSTATRGVGNRVNSYQTPLGWHIVADKIGEGMPWGAIFESREFTGKIWSGNQETNDLILTRILRLQGIEPGINQGEGIDSYERYIYIHATPEEQKLGSPASHGCVRISNNAILQLFTQTELNTHVLITEW